MSEPGRVIDSLAARRAVEALRNGVPNGDAVRALGCMQPHVVDRFTAMLESLSSSSDDHLPVVSGLLVSGDFGAGKSHLLEYLAQQALSEGYVCSTVVVSKETPLFDPVKVVNAILREARVPGSRGTAVEELAQRVDYGSTTAEGLVRWAAQAPGLLGATVMLHQRSQDGQLLQRITDFWGGERLGVAEIRSGLRQVGAKGAFEVKTLTLKQLAPLRLEFAVRLARAVGLRGWVLFLDEVELVGRYSQEQRGRSYAELARWLGNPGTPAIPGVACVATITNDYDVRVLKGKNDLTVIPERTRAKGADDSLTEAARMEAGMRAIERGGNPPLLDPTAETLHHTYVRVRGIYRDAYGWEPSDVELGEIRITKTMRSYIKRWINEWDLRRIYPGAQVTLEEDVISTSYQEDTALEQESETSERG